MLLNLKLFRMIKWMRIYFSKYTKSTREIKKMLVNKLNNLVINLDLIYLYIELAKKKAIYENSNYGRNRVRKL